MRRRVSWLLLPASRPTVLCRLASLPLFIRLLMPGGLALLLLLTRLLLLLFFTLTLLLGSFAPAISAIG